ncbi:MAG: hypothetical protein GY860_15820 [Desulfobacteraceae bacterium]|nr:hypothetical protein [Desulfobacteraceae bacterium]
MVDKFYFDFLSACFILSAYFILYIGKRKERKKKYYEPIEENLPPLRWKALYQADMNKGNILLQVLRPKIPGRQIQGSHGRIS